jgi:hypothetical protein
MLTAPSGLSGRGSQTGSQRPQDPGDVQPHQATELPGQSNIRPCPASSGDAAKSPSKQLVAGSIPARRAARWLFFEISVAVGVLNRIYCLEAAALFEAFARVWRRLATVRSGRVERILADARTSVQWPGTPGSQSESQWRAATGGCQLWTQWPAERAPAQNLDLSRTLRSPNRRGHRVGRIGVQSRADRPDLGCLPLDCHLRLLLRRTAVMRV